MAGCHLLARQRNHKMPLKRIPGQDFSITGLLAPFGQVLPLPRPKRRACMRQGFGARPPPKVLGAGRPVAPILYKIRFCFLILSTVRAKPGSPQLSEPYCPPNAVQNPMFESRTKSVFLDLLVYCPCQALVAPFIILSGSHPNAHQNFGY